MSTRKFINENPEKKKVKSEFSGGIKSQYIITDRLLSHKTKSEI